MKRRDFLGLTVGAGASVWLARVGSSSEKTRTGPNFVLIVLDEKELVIEDFAEAIMRTTGLAPLP